MARMSHCSGASGSALAFGGLRAVPRPPRPRHGFSIASRRLTWSRGACPIGWLAAAPSSAGSLAARVSKPASSERTVATPIAAFSSTMLPPASAIAAWASCRLAPAL